MSLAGPSGGLTKSTGDTEGGMGSILDMGWVNHFEDGLKKIHQP